MCYVILMVKKNKKKKERNENWQSTEFYKIDFKFDFINVLNVKNYKSIVELMYISMLYLWLCCSFIDRQEYFTELYHY